MMVRQSALLVVAAALVTLVAGCSLVTGLGEVRAVETKLKDSGFANVKVNVSTQTKSNVTTHSLTAAVDRPRNAEFDQKLGTRVADIVFMNYPSVKDLDTITVELNGSGAGTTQKRSISEWRDLARDFRDQPGIATAQLSKNVRGENFEVVDAATDFPAEQAAFHAVIAVRNLPPDTAVKGVWVAVDTHGAAPPNQVVVDSEVKAQGTQRLHFKMEPTAGKLPRGSYKLDVSWSGKVERSLPFTVAGG